MSERSFVRRHWKLALNIITVAALIILIYAIRRQLGDTFRNLAKVDAWALFLLLPIQWLNYHSQTKMYQGLFKVVGDRLRYKFLFIASLELNFVNHVFPSGGVSGISYFGLRLKNGQISAGKATLVQIMKVVLLILSFELLLIIGLLFMAIGNRVNDVVIMMTTLLSTLMVVGTFVFVRILRSEQRIHSTFVRLTRFVNRLLHIFFRNVPEMIEVKRVERAVLDLHQNYKLLETRYRDLKRTFFWALMANLTEVLSIYVVYVAFGEWVNFGSIILAYAIANVAGLISVMPGGVGVYEALMTAVLVAAGIPARLSLPVTVMYRVLNTLIQVPPGYYFYQKELRRNQNLLERQLEMHDQ